MMDFMFVPLTIFLSVVAPIWLIAHYLTRWRTAKSLSAEDEQMLAELWETAPRLEERLANLEGILDAEVPSWRDRPEAT
jgi:phage shock protein B